MLKAIVNKVHFTINLTSIFLVVVLYKYEIKTISGIILPLLLPINVGVLFCFLWFYTQDVKDDQSMRCSTFLDDIDKDLHTKVYITEGKYLMYFIWGGNVFAKIKP